MQPLQRSKLMMLNIANIVIITITPICRLLRFPHNRRWTCQRIIRIPRMKSRQNISFKNLTIYQFGGPSRGCSRWPASAGIETFPHWQEGQRRGQQENHPQMPALHVHHLHVPAHEKPPCKSWRICHEFHSFSQRAHDNFVGQMYICDVCGMAV